MDIYQLKIFSKVAELKSFSKAAEAVYLTQPTVSGHIRTLEIFLGTKLFDRLGKETVLTKSGKLLYQYAQEIISLREKAIQDLNDLIGIQKGDLIIGGSTIPGEYILPSLIGKFKKTNPKINILLKISDTQTITRKILDGEIELGIVGSKSTDQQIEYHLFRQDNLCLIVPKDHRWNLKKSITFEGLSAEPFVMREKGSGTRKTIENHLHKIGKELADLNIVSEMGSTEAVKQGIKANLGISILSKIAVLDELNYGIFKEIKVEGINFTRNFYVLRHQKRSLSPLAEIFMKFLLNN